jgi:hypothetical protein
MEKAYSDPARKAWPFLLFFMLVGVGLLTPFVLQAIRDYRIANLYQQTECDVLDRHAIISTSSTHLGGSWYREEFAHDEFTWVYTVAGLRYTAEGYDNHDGIMAAPQGTGNISKGTHMACWYDPASPEDSVLARNFQPKFYLGALIPGSFILFGGLLLRGVLRRKRQKIQVAASKGEHLSYRLSTVLSTKGVMGCLGVLVLVVGMIIVLVLPKLSMGHFTPSIFEGNEWLYIFSAGIEGFLIYHFGRAMRAARVPDPIVEIDADPLQPGQNVRLYLLQSGPARLASFQVQIVCEETGPSGTRVIHKTVLVERKDLTLTSPEEFNETFNIPENASPSSKTVQTLTNWYVRVQRQFANGKPYDTDYPFRVLRAQDQADKP